MIYNDAQVILSEFADISELQDKIVLNIAKEDTDETAENIVSFNAISHKNDILQYYLKDIGKIKLLKRSDELELG